MSNQSILPQQQQIKINLDELERVQCEGCQGEEFDRVWVIRKVPAMLSKTGKVALFPVAYFRCTSCLKVTNIVHQA
jgi:hypothetical protein